MILVFVVLKEKYIVFHPNLSAFLSHSNQSHSLEYLAGDIPIIWHLSTHPLKLDDQNICKVFQVIEFDWEDRVSFLAFDTVWAYLLERNRVLVKWFEQFAHYLRWLLVGCTVDVEWPLICGQLQRHRLRLMLFRHLMIWMTWSILYAAIPTFQSCLFLVSLRRRLLYLTRGRSCILDTLTILLAIAVESRTVHMLSCLVGLFFANLTWSSLAMVLLVSSNDRITS